MEFSGARTSMEKKIINVEEIEEGMLTAEDVMAHGHVVILKKEQEIESKHLSLFKTVGIEKIEVLVPEKKERKSKTHVDDYPEYSERLKTASVMIVDDSKLMRLKLKKIVEGAGLTLAGEAEDGSEAILMVTDLNPTLITMDIEMPNIDGLSAIGPVLEKLPSAKIIMISSLGYDEKIIEAISAGAIDFISKPFDPEQVQKTILGAIVANYGF
jgi:two-component system, chemotaxis family, chemotaxis protein CheY